MRVIAVLFLLYGACSILLGVAIVFAQLDRLNPPFVQYLLPPARLIVGSFAILAGVGLLYRAEWGRPTATLMALVSLPFFPEGTLFGPLALWWLSRTAQPPGVSAAPAPTASA